MTVFWHPALARNQIWRTLLGTVIAAAVYLALTAAAFLAAAKTAERGLGATDPVGAIGTTPVGAALFFGTFFGLHLGLMFSLRVLHRRAYTTLFGPTRRLTLAQLGRGLALALAIGAASYLLLAVEHLVLPAGVAPQVSQNLPVATWATWLAPAIALIFVQILAEEALFRGYLLQQLRARFSSPLVWAVLPSVLFGLLHYDAGTYGTLNASAYVLNASVLGTLAAFITLRTGNLGAAVGLHFGNNILLVLVGLEGSLDGFSLYTVGLDLKSGYTAYSILTQTAAFALAFALWWRWMKRHRPIANADAGP